MGEATIVVTNDDGIESHGLRRLVAALEPLGEVVAVAPAANQSAVGRSIEARATVESHPLGYAVHGSPATCVVAAATGLDLEPALVVSGVNKGANLGGPMLGRSGTVGAAVEAAYLGYPAIAVSTYVPFERLQGAFHEFTPDPAEYAPAASVAGHLAERLLEGVPLDGADYLNVNAPLAADLVEPVVHVTAPADGYHTVADRDGDQLSLRDRQFELIHTGDLDPSHDTDRGALAAGQISVSPLCLPEQVPTPERRSAIARGLFDEVPTHLSVPTE